MVMEGTISLKEIFKILKKRLWLIVAFVFGTAFISAIISYFILTPTYQLSSQFIVNQRQTDSNLQYNVNDIRMNVELINTYHVIIKSPAILDDVGTELNLSISSRQLADKIQVSSEQNSQVVTVTATDADPDLATQIANTTVEIFQEKIPVLMNGVDNVNILSTAVTPSDPTPVTPKPKLNIAIALVLGGMIGGGLAFLLEYLDNTITTEADIEQLGLPLLGVISNMESKDVFDGHAIHRKNQIEKRGWFSVQAGKKREV